MKITLVCALWLSAPARVVSFPILTCSGKKEGALALWHRLTCGTSTQEIGARGTDHVVPQPPDSPKQGPAPYGYAIVKHSPRA